MIICSVNNVAAAWLRESAELPSPLERNYAQSKWWEVEAMRKAWDELLVLNVLLYANVIGQHDTIIVYCAHGTRSTCIWITVVVWLCCVRFEDFQRSPLPVVVKHLFHIVNLFRFVLSDLCCGAPPHVQCMRMAAEEGDAESCLPSWAKPSKSHSYVDMCYLTRKWRNMQESVAHEYA